MMINERTKTDIIEILDNIVYWDSCPIAYKEKIPSLIKELKQVKNIAYEPVLANVNLDKLKAHKLTDEDKAEIDRIANEPIPKWPKPTWEQLNKPMDI